MYNCMHILHMGMKCEKPVVKMHIFHIRTIVSPSFSVFDSRDWFCVFPGTSLCVSHCVGITHTHTRAFFSSIYHICAHFREDMMCFTF